MSLPARGMFFWLGFKDTIFAFGFDFLCHYYWHPCIALVQSLTHTTTPAGTHVGYSDCVGGVLARSCSGADLRQPGIPRRARGPI